MKIKYIENANRYVLIGWGVGSNLNVVNPSPGVEEERGVLKRTIDVLAVLLSKVTVAVS